MKITKIDIFELDCTGSQTKWRPVGVRVYTDKVHFTAAGYELMGDVLYNALIERYMEQLRLTAKKN